MSLRAISLRLGLSVTTVSRALGGFSDVAAATRHRVAAEAARIGYRPNAAARQLRRGSADAIGVVLPTGPGQLDDAFFLHLLGSIGPHLSAAGLDLIVGTARAGVEEASFYRQLVENRRVDGVIVARTRRQDPRVDYLLGAGMPFVIHGRTDSRQPHAFVDVDGEAAFRHATERLLNLGHRHIAMLNAPLDYSFAWHRARGFRAAMTEAGLVADIPQQAEPTEENGFRMAQALLASDGLPTALLCATDRLAVGAMRALAQAGLRIGSDISVIGYDDLPSASYTDPPLTTFDPDIAGCAARMVRMMLALLGGAPAAGMADLREARLIVRASDGRAPGAHSAVQHRDRPKRRRIQEETRHEENPLG